MMHTLTHHTSPHTLTHHNVISRPSSTGEVIEVLTWVDALVHVGEERGGQLHTAGGGTDVLVRAAALLTPAIGDPQDNRQNNRRTDCQQ